VRTVAYGFVLFPRLGGKPLGARGSCDCRSGTSSWGWPGVALNCFVFCPMLQEVKNCSLGNWSDKKMEKITHWCASQVGFFSCVRGETIKCQSIWTPRGEVNQLGDLGVDGEIILKCILRKWTTVWLTPVAGRSVVVVLRCGSCRSVIRQSGWRRPLLTLSWPTDRSPPTVFCFVLEHRGTRQCCEVQTEYKVAFCAVSRQLADVNGCAWKRPPTRTNIGSAGRKIPRLL
jgi:hypothetical protein